MNQHRQHTIPAESFAAHQHVYPTCREHRDGAVMICRAVAFRACWPCRTHGHDDPPPRGFETPTPTERS